MGFGSDNKKLKEQQHRQLRKIRAASVNFNVFIPSCSICQMLTIFFWSWIPKDCVKVQEKKKKVLSCVHVLHKMWNKEFLCGSSAVTAKK